MGNLLTWVGIATYCVFVVTQHENVQQILVPIADRMGRGLFYTMFGGGAAAMGVIALWTFWKSSEASEAREALRWQWALASFFTLASFGLLTVNNAEVVHYPQYFMLAVALFPFLRSVGETLAWCTFVALIDEGYQYFVIHPTWGVPWDFNDVTLDICGGWLGALWIASQYRVLPNETGRWWKRAGVMMLSGGFFAVGVLVGLGKVQLYENKNYVGWWFALSRMKPEKFWFFDATWGPRTVHLLSPTEGPLLMLTMVMLACMIDRKYRFSK